MLVLQSITKVPLDKPVLLLTETGLISAWFHKPDDQEDGPVWVCYDDITQIEVEETPQGYEHAGILGWYDLDDIYLPEGYLIPSAKGMMNIKTGEVENENP